MLIDNLHFRHLHTLGTRALLTPLLFASQILTTMSQSNISSASDAVPTKDDEQPEPLAFTLTIVSPSVGVASRLSFPHLPATTTVQQLKSKIRDSLPSKPQDDHQRLIHRGRMLARETETMLDIFGQDTVGIYASIDQENVITDRYRSLLARNHKFFI